MYIFVIVALLVFLLIVLRTRVKSEPYIQGPTNSSWIPQWNFLDYTKTTKEALQNVLKYPKIFHVDNILGRSYIVHDPALVKEVMLTKSNSYLNRVSLEKIYHREKVYIYKSLLMMKDDAWKERRRLLSPYFTTSKLLPLLPIFHFQAKLLVEQLKEKIGTFDIQEAFSCLTADVLGEAGFGTSFELQKKPNNPIKTHVKNIVGIQQFIYMVFIPFWHILPIPIIKKYLQAQDALRKLCDNVIQMRTRGKIKKNDLLQALIDLELPPLDLIAEAALFLIAGHETTASSLSWVMYNLSKNPEVEKKMVQEIFSVFGDRENITHEDLDKLQYIDCVINETLRIDPPVLQISRTVSDDSVTLNGYQFRRGTKIFVPVWAIHHNPNIWKNPETFDPSRWENNFVPPAGTFLPFGYGPRMCIGSKFSMLEAKIVLAHLYKNFTFKLMSKEEDIYPKIRDIVVHPRELKVQAIKRT